MSLLHILQPVALGLGAAAAIALGSALLYLAFFLPFSLRSMQLLPKEPCSTVDGVTTLEDAVAACRQSGLRGIELAAFAQRLTARKMRYSRRNPWDSWERCFERGQGYCIQKGMALKLILDRLGIESVPVQSLRCAFPPDVVHGVREPARISGHFWLRVSMDDTLYDVCPGSFSNRPGVIHFRILAPVTRVRPWTLPMLHVFSAAENVRRDWKNLFARRP